MYIINSKQFGEIVVHGVATNLKMLTFLLSETYDEIFEVNEHSNEKPSYKDLCAYFKDRKDYAKKSLELCDFAEDTTTIKITYVNETNELS